MIFGKSKLILLFIVIAAGAPSVDAQVAKAQAIQSPATIQASNETLLKSVMNRLSLVTTAKANFTEQRFSKLLDAPTESTGTLVYTAPNRFEKHTLKPVEERMSVERDIVTLEQVARKQKRSIFIGQNPALTAVIDGMRGALSGNLPALQQNFSVTAQGSSTSWQINMVPFEAKQLGYVRNIKVSGKENVIDSIEIQQADGDRSIMSMTRADK
jgi:outer membrane lipoprotein-sorting protein